MSSCENSVKVHEPLFQAVSDQECCSEVCRDPHLEALPCLDGSCNLTDCSVGRCGVSDGSTVSADNPQEQLQHFPFVSDHMLPVVATSQPESHILNFTISSGLAGFNNRGTLQSNSSSTSFPPHLQRSSYSIDVSTNVPFPIGSAKPSMDNHHQFPRGLPLSYVDGSRHSDQKGKGKN